MIRTFLNAKIHKATVTDSKMEYIGSCQIDIELLNAVNILPNEKIDIYNITNGERFSTYAIEGPPGSGMICINGAACHKAGIGDHIIICTYTNLKESEIANHSPRVIYVDSKNRITPKDTNTKLKMRNG